MALTNQQYESIMKGYESARTRNRHQLEERRERVYRLLPEYEQLDQSIGTISIAYGKYMLNQAEGQDGQPNMATGSPDFPKSQSDLHAALAEIRHKKRTLLLEAMLPEDYLDPIYDCPDCQDTGYLVGQNTKCHCFRAQEINLLYEQSNIREIISQENFSTLSFQYYEGEDRKRFQEAVRISLDFSQNFEKDYQNLLFYGTVGTGKSFLSGCIAHELLSKGHSVIYFSASGLFDTLARYSFDVKAKESLYQFYQDLYQCDLIIIDDLGTEVTNSFVTSQLFACLNERALRRKSTIISTNLSLEELRDRYSDRVFSRLTSNYTICKLTGPDIRIYKKRMRK